ncbi:MAG: lysophospholipid acyltransferase family protein [Acidaminococcaceae bacterium]|nr:lysophospholipid acyltransferase family protein [Acidaminococcaceae bacterium]
MLYAALKVLSFIFSHMPYGMLIAMGKGAGKIYYYVAKKQRLRAEETIKECLGYSDAEANTAIHELCKNLGMTFLEIFALPSLNRDNVGRYVKIQNREVLEWALAEKHGVVLVACHMDNWEWSGATLALNGYPLSAVEKPQPNQVYSDFMNELRRGAGQEIFSRGTTEILGCARAMKKGRMVGLIADQDGGETGIFVPFLGKMASTPQGPVYFARKFQAPIIPVFILRNAGGKGHVLSFGEPVVYRDTGNKVEDDYVATLAYSRQVEEMIKKYPNQWIWFQHRWNTPYQKG